MNTSPLVGLLLFAAVMAGMLSFNARLCIFAAIAGVVFLGIQFLRKAR